MLDVIKTIPASTVEQTPKLKALTPALSACTWHTGSVGSLHSICAHFTEMEFLCEPPGQALADTQGETDKQWSWFDERIRSGN